MLDKDQTSKMLDELRAIRHILEIQSRDELQKELERVATTPERKEIWRLCDGTRSNDEIAKQIGITLRSVQYFVQDAITLNLLTQEKRGTPKRQIDYVPPKWPAYKKKKEKKKEALNEQPREPTTGNQLQA